MRDTMDKIPRWDGSADIDLRDDASEDVNRGVDDEEDADAAASRGVDIDAVEDADDEDGNDLRADVEADVDGLEEDTGVLTVARGVVTVDGDADEETLARADAGGEVIVADREGRVRDDDEEGRAD
jgi:hypothetical protein